MAGTVENRRAERRTNIVQGTVLVIDDEADIRELLELSLLRMGLAVECAGSVAAAKQLLESKRYELCLTDMRLPDGDGLELVRFIGVQYADLPVAVITAFGSTENAVAALKAGAFDYLTKPLSLDQLRTLVKSALSLPQKAAAAKSGEGQLLGSSPGIEQVRSKIEKLARSQAPIYLTGESGSGKELAARLIHGKGSRRERPFVPVNCGAIPENLMESEFFGYKKGAFTGAEGDRDGFFQAANTGTLFLDEVADLPLAMQVKLLRVIQEKTVRKVGATSEDAVDVRIICATHQNLAACVESGKFRQDLYYRLAVIELRMPRCGSAATISRCSRMRFCGVFPVPTASSPCGSPRKRRKLSRATIFPAILANWRTFWSAPSPSPRARKSNPTTCSSLRRLGSLVNREPPTPNGRSRNTSTVSKRRRSSRP